jgi:hypothetical protein
MINRFMVLLVGAHDSVELSQRYCRIGVVVPSGPTHTGHQQRFSPCALDMARSVLGRNSYPGQLRCPGRRFTTIGSLLDEDARRGVAADDVRRGLRMQSWLQSYARHRASAVPGYLLCGTQLLIHPPHPSTLHGEQSIVCIDMEGNIPLYGSGFGEYVGERSKTMGWVPHLSKDIHLAWCAWESGHTGTPFLVKHGEAVRTFPAFMSTNSSSHIAEALEGSVPQFALPALIALTKKVGILLVAMHGDLDGANVRCKFWYGSELAAINQVRQCNLTMLTV